MTESSHFWFWWGFFVDWNMLLCNFQREQKWERWLSTIGNGMRMHKTIVLVFLHRIAASQTEISFENNIKDFMESEIWQHKYSKKMRNRFSKSWLPYHNILLISVFMLIQSSFYHLMNQHYSGLQIYKNFVKIYIHLYPLGCHIASIFMLTKDRNWKC